MTTVDTRKCPSGALDRLDVCDGYGAPHFAVAVPEVHSGVTLYRAGCNAGCVVPGAMLAGSEQTALSQARAALTCPTWQHCDHAAETTVEDVYGYHPWPDRA